MAKLCNFSAQIKPCYLLKLDINLHSGRSYSTSTASPAYRFNHLLHNLVKICDFQDDFLFFLFFFLYYFTTSIIIIIINFFFFWSLFFWSIFFFNNWEISTAEIILENGRVGGVEHDHFEDNSLDDVVVIAVRMLSESLQGEMIEITAFFHCIICLQEYLIFIKNEPKRILR